MNRPLLAALTAIVVIGTAAPGAAVIPPDTRCRSGEVALTFDDGPSRVDTPRLLTILRRHQAQATFFVQGSRAQRRPGVLRAMVRDGHAVEDHSWDHPVLTRRTSRGVERQLRRTQRVIRRATGHDPSFYRPPYGATNRRVRAVARRSGLREVLWTIDSRDWAGRSSRGIRKAALAGLRPHRRNVILLHDGVTNSPATLRAVPGIVRGLRSRGYCLVPLEPMMAPDRVTAAPVTAIESSPATVTVALDGPAQRDGSFRVRSQDGTATAGEDYLPVGRTVEVRRGDRRVTVLVGLLGDSRPDPDRTFTLHLDRPRHVRIGTPDVPVTIRDDGSWSEPLARLLTSTTSAPATLGP